MTNEVLSSTLLIPNHSLRKQIECFIEAHGLKLRSTKSSPFKYLLRILRLHGQRMKGMHSAANTLRRNLYLFEGDDAAPSGYEVVLRRFLSEWTLFSAEIQRKWVDVMASTIYIKDRIYLFHQSHFEEDGDDGDSGQSVGGLSLEELFAFHFVKSLISIKTSLREIVGLQLKLQFLLNFVLDNVSLSAFSKRKRKRPRPLPSAQSADPSSASSPSPLPSVDEEKSMAMEVENEEEEEQPSSGWMGSDFEDDLTAFSMIAGVMIAANAGGSSGAAVGSAGGPVGTMFGAAIGFYVGAIAGSAPSMLYGLYVEEHRVRKHEMDRLWKAVFRGMKRYHLWIDRERKQFELCDRILVQCIHSITHCVDHPEDAEAVAAEEDVDWIYESVNEELVGIWQHDISRITPFLQQCLSAAE